MICSDCQGEMVEGFIIDRNHGASGVVPRWVEGRPVESLWGGIKYKDRECRAVETYRCLDCGLLKSYARVKIDNPLF